MRRFLILSILFSALSAHADEAVFATVVSIYRPLEMESRRVGVERKVFIQSTTEDDFSEKLVGQTLTVFRLRRVPAQVSMTRTFQSEDMVLQNSDADANQPSQSKAERLSPLDSGRPSGFAAPSQQTLSNPPTLLGAKTSAGDQVVNVTDSPIEAAIVKTKIGEIKVLSVEGNVAIAAVVNDGIRKSSQRKPKVSKVEGSTVSAGDLAEGVIAKVIPKKRAKSLSASERKALRNERSRIRKMNRPKKKRGKYKRKHMKWDL